MGLFLAVESDYLELKKCCEARDYNDPEIQKRRSRRTLDVETELLEGELEEELFMKLKLPTGYEEVLEDLVPDIKDITEGLDK